MTCPKCQHSKVNRFGTTGKAKVQRYRCRDCSATFSPRPAAPLGSHTTSMDASARVIAMLCEGMSVRAVSRLTGIHKNTILRLLVTIGGNCERVLDARVRNLASQRVQCDELWSFVGCKEKRVTTNHPLGHRGDAWTWTAMDPDTKLMIAWRVGTRAKTDAFAFMHDVAARLTNRVQITTDGFPTYVSAVESAFGNDVDYAVLNKVYAAESQGRYSPSRMVGAERIVIRGNPDPLHISTSYVERHNLTIRMGLRRFTRLTNGFSKKLGNLRAAVAVFMAWYNFCRVHQTLRVTPAMQSGLTDHVWTIPELLAA